MGIYSWSVRNIGYPLWLRRDGQSGALKELDRLKRSQFHSRTQLQDLKRERLVRLLQHAFTNCPYYRGIFRDSGWTMKSFQDFENLKRLPILTKDVLSTNLEQLVAENIPRSALHRTASGGSTGRHTPFYRDNACLAIKWASEWRFHQWTGWDLGEPVGLIWPVHQDLNPSPNWTTHQVLERLYERCLQIRPVL
jgi:phenylacetate-CoA ligase